MSTEWIIDVFIRQHMTKQKELNSVDNNRYYQDDKMFVCDCCNSVWQTAWYGEIDVYKDFPTIGKKTKRMPGHENSKNNL
tara:strand:+ start:3578 stop:3817 length:240 start_codon:yes stop_codon:yes gene_type:complete